MRRLSHFLCDNDDNVIIESLLYMSIHMSAHSATGCYACTDREGNGVSGCRNSAPLSGPDFTAIASPWSPVTTGEAMEPGPFYAHYMRVT